MMFVYFKFFNLIFILGIMFEMWCCGFIILIFKLGDRSDLLNYWGICVLSCLGKFFCFILN